MVLNNRERGSLNWVLGAVFAFCFAFSLAPRAGAVPIGAAGPCAQQPCFDFLGYVDANTNYWSSACPNGNPNCARLNAQSNWWAQNNNGGMPTKTGNKFDLYLWNGGGNLLCTNLDANGNPVSPAQANALFNPQLWNAGRTQYSCQ